MVELEVEDYNEILDWFLLAFGKKSAESLPSKAKKNALQTDLPRRRQDKGRNGPARH